MKRTPITLIVHRFTLRSLEYEGVLEPFNIRADQSKSQSMKILESLIMRNPVKNRTMDSNIRPICPKDIVPFD